MALSHAFSGELHSTKVAAIFDDDARAREVARRLRLELALGHGQVRVIHPRDPVPGRKLEPEVSGIRRTLVRSHLTMGVGGALIGAALFVLLRVTGVTMIVSSATISLLVLMFYGAVSGLLIGGLVGLRPDHDAYVHTVLSEVRHGRAAVVVHARNGEERDRADAMLSAAGATTVTTL
ncbi:riboflavin biosynthesis protein RibA [Lysobacter maris]|uniref:Riboflavin biosynthesis protein RibA n=1 Tax=Marilutibacter maris TaxID=1605891 RepID=A0A508B2B3_9GAMM|nr:riboflavin biosynthesis protein RibA [Lysobacter maris]KAB8198139.1 riboflavin biosynthesis protein RibA [Lysobacter maris]